MNTGEDLTSMVDTTTSGTPVSSSDDAASAGGADSVGSATGGTSARRRRSPRPAKRAAEADAAVPAVPDVPLAPEALIEFPAVESNGDPAPAKRTAAKRTATKRTAAKRVSANDASANDGSTNAAQAGAVGQPGAAEVVAAELAALSLATSAAAVAEAEPVAPARRRASRKRASAAPEIPVVVEAEPSTQPAVTPSEPDAPVAAADQPEGAAAADKPRAGRRRRSRAVSSPFEEPAASLEAGTAAATAVPSPAVPAVQAPAATAEAAPETRRGSGALATTMLLFQPPAETAAPRRRRSASRPAGPPQLQTSFGGTADASSEDDVSATPVEAGATVVIEATVIEPEVIEPALIEPEEAIAEAELLVDVDDSEEDDESDEAGESDESGDIRRRRRRRGGRGRRGRNRASSDGDADSEGEPAGPDADAGTEDTEAGTEDSEEEDESDDEGQAGTGSRRRRRRRRRGSAGDADGGDDPPNTVTRVREPRKQQDDTVTALKGSTRLEAKKQRRREGRETGRRRHSITEAEFLARRESVERTMIVREREGRTQIGVLEDGVLVEHYVARRSQTSMVGNVYLGKVQNVLSSMEAAFVDVGKGRNAVLYAGEVNWDAAGLDGQPKRIEHALKSGEPVLVQVTKDPIGHKGARLTSQISLPGRFLVYVPNGSMTGISRKLPDNERTRLKKILREIVPEDAGVIVRTAAEGASEEELTGDVARLQAQWEDIERKSRSGNAPALLYGEPDLAIRVVRDIFNEDFASLVVDGQETFETLQGYLGHVAPDLVDRVTTWDGAGDVFAANRIDEQLAKAMDRKVWLPSGGSLVIDRTEAMTVVDVNTGKFTGSGGNLEETVTKNNIEAAEEIVRQMRLRDIGGIIVVDFIDMVLESNRDLVLRRLLECLGRDRTKHQVAEVTSLGLVQMTRKRVGSGLLEVFSEQCEHCGGRGLVIHDEPVEKREPVPTPSPGGGGGRQRGPRGQQHVAVAND